MKITTTIKPYKYQARTKYDLLSKFNSYPTTYSSSRGFSYSGVMKKNDDTIIVYNLHKVRRKVKRLKKKQGQKVAKSQVIREGHWIAYVYHLNLDLLRLSGVKSIKQGLRNFKIEF